MILSEDLVFANFPHRVSISPGKYDHDARAWLTENIGDMALFCGIR